MNERILEAISKLKKLQDELEVKLKTMQQSIDEKGSLNMQKALFTVADDLARYTIKDGNWYYNGKDTGIQAEAHDGEDGKQGPQGKTGKPGRDGKDGKPGKDGKNGKDGRPGRDGKDGIVPDLKIGKIEVSPEYGGAMAKLRPGKNNIIYLDLTLPRGPQGFTGFDGKDAKINGVNTLNIEAGDNIEIHQVDDTMVISGTVDSFEIKVVDQLPTENISTSTIYFVPSQSVGTNNIYDEYVYINKGTQVQPQYVWELIGTTEIDLTNYVTNTDYASNNTAGVIKLNASGYGTSVDPNGALRALVKNYEQYESSNSYYMIGKGTLENVITGKGLNISSINSGENINITNLLPNEYTRLEYIESSGTQYININITPTTTMGINIDYAYPTVDSNTNAGICGTFQNAYPRTDTFFITSNNGKTASTLFFAHRGTQVDSGTMITANKKYNAKINWLNNGKIEFGDSVFNIKTNNVETDEIHLFGRKSGNNYAYTVARIYGCQFSEETKIIRNLIPAKRNSDNVIGMYDTVNETFYENSGTGTFTAGAVLNNIPKINFVNNSGYVKNTDYATSVTGGVVKTGYSINVDTNGNLYVESKSYSDYDSMGSDNAISKGTLENVITGRALENKYSMSEIKTGTWIDNKPVYRRFFTINLGAASNISQAHSLTDLDKFWINQSASFVFRYNESLPSTWYYSDTDWARTWMTNTSIRFRSPIDLTNRVLWVAVEYTKTTD